MVLVLLAKHAVGVLCQYVDCAFDEVLDPMSALIC